MMRGARQRWVCGGLLCGLLLSRSGYATLESDLLVPSPTHVAQLSGSSDVRPIPDPTVLTTQAMAREFQSLKELIFTRLDAMDKALVLLQARADRVPSEVDIKVGQLQALHTEKFRSVDNQFTASSTALAVALQSAKEAVDKSSLATAKAIDQLTAVLAVETKAINDKVADLRERLVKIEGRDSGFASSWSILAVAVGLLLALAGFWTNMRRRDREV